MDHSFEGPDMSIHTNKLLTSLCLMGAMTGCVSLSDEMKVKDYVRNRASFDFSCPKEKIEVLELASKTFSATGCDKKGVFNCLYAGNWYEGARLECVQEAQKRNQ